MAVSTAYVVDLALQLHADRWVGFVQANAGDSRSVLCVKGEAIAMSYDHKPVNKEENARIVAAGGFVEFGRVNGTQTQRMAAE